MKINIFDTDKQYDIIYADPPWEYRQSGSTRSGRGMAKAHYQTMSTDMISQLPVIKISSKNAVCFMWATFPNIAEALKVMEKWGFVYKTAAFVWIKENKKRKSLFWGMGAYTRANAEVCLLGIKKAVRARQIVKSHAVHQVVISPVECHSKKPEEVKKRIVELLGDIPRIELFAREKCAGWDCWGDEI